MSHVVNGTRFVEPETAGRVKEAILALGFAPNRVAQGLRTGSTKTIAVMGLTSLDRLFAEVIRGIEERCYARGFEVFLGLVEYEHGLEVMNLAEIDRQEEGFLDAVFSGKERTSSELLARFKTLAPSKEDKIVAQFLARDVDGMILNAGQSDENLVRSLVNVKKPYLLYQRHLPELACDFCLSDDYSGVSGALDRLYEQGHRRFAMVYGFSWESHAARERFRAWVDFHKRRGLPLEAQDLRQGLYDLEVTVQRTKDLMRLPHPPTAILYWSDLMAMAALDTLRELGIAVPGEVSIVGFDDLDFAAWSSPRLSTVRQAKLETGHRMADRLIDRIEGKTDPEPTRLIATTTYIERQSTGPVSATGGRPSAEGPSDTDTDGRLATK